jgi:hypothetical protein
MTVLGIGWESENSRRIPKFIDRSEADFGMLGMREGSKYFQLHIKWPVWIHTKMIMMTFSKYVPSYP